jgi:uncharacterized membrane protein
MSDDTCAAVTATVIAVFAAGVEAVGGSVLVCLVGIAIGAWVGVPILRWLRRKEGEGRR